MKHLTLAAAVFFIHAAQVFSQGPAAIWDYKEYDSRSAAAVKIEVELPLGTASGTGTVVLKSNEKHPTKVGYVKAYVITAAHVIAGSNKYRILFQSGDVYEEAEGVAYSLVCDVAILEVYVKTSQPYLKIAKTVEDGETVRVCGFGGRRSVYKPRYFEAKIARVTSDKNKMFLYEDVIPGDSGSAIVNKAGEVVGIVSGGSAWFSNEKSDRYTWPARCCGTNVINQLVEKYRPAKPYVSVPLPLNYVDLNKIK